MATIFTGWPEQYQRMLRSHARLTNYARGHEHVSSADARDALIHFFQDAFHLKDWLKGDQGEAAIGYEPARAPVAQNIKGAVEGYVKNTPELAICADIANGSKHLVLTTAKTGDLATAVTGQGVTVRLGSGALHNWRIESGGAPPYDALDLADRIVSAWETWLRQQSLLT